MEIIFGLFIVVLLGVIGYRWFDYTFRESQKPSASDKTEDEEDEK